METSKITHTLVKSIFCGLTILGILAIPSNATALVYPGPGCGIPILLPPSGTYVAYGYTDSSSSIGKGECVAVPSDSARIVMKDPQENEYPQRQASAVLSGPMGVSAYVGDQFPSGLIVESSSSEAGLWNTYIVSGPEPTTELTLNFSLNGVLLLGNNFAGSSIRLEAYLLDYPSYETGNGTTWQRSLNCEPDGCELSDGFGPGEPANNPEHFHNVHPEGLTFTVPVGEPFGFEFILQASSAFVGVPSESYADFRDTLEFGFEEQDLFTLPSGYSIEEFQGTSEPTTLSPTSDSMLRRLSRNRNEGANPRLRLTSIGKNRAVVTFDPGEINAFGEIERATLVLTVAENGSNWGKDGREVIALPLAVEFAEGNGKAAGLLPHERTRGTGEGVTWNCAIDSDISNFRRNCSDSWYGGDFGGPTADPVIHTNQLSGTDEVAWDVTEDVIAGAIGWVVKKVKEWRGGYVYYYSKEGSEELAPKLILE